MDTNINDVIEINIKELMRALLRKSWLIVLVGIIFGAAARYYSMNYIIPTYTSSAKLYIINQEEGQTTTLSDIQIGTYLTQDYKILVKSRPVAAEVIEKLKLNMSCEELISMISVYSPEETRILVISVTYYDIDMVKLLVDTIAEVSSKRLVTIMGMDEVNVVEDGNIPWGPSNPNITRNTEIAGILGMMITAFIITFVYLFNDTIKTSEDIEKYLNITTLGYIPIETTVKKKRSKQKHKDRKAA